MPHILGVGRTFNGDRMDRSLELRLAIISFGKERSLDPGSNEDTWTRNRNAGTVVIGLGSP